MHLTQRLRSELEAFQVTHALVETGHPQSPLKRVSFCAAVVGFAKGVAVV